MHETQAKLLELAHRKKLGNMTLLAIADLIGEKYAQSVKHHLNQLVKNGLLMKDLEPVKSGKSDDTNLFSIPIYGTANCGPATLFSEQSIKGYIKISDKLLPRQKRGLYALKALGNSLNKSNIDGDSIENGDYVIVDGDNISPTNNKYVIAIIDGSAIMKKYKEDGDRILLLSESTQDYPPIVLHREDDINNLICGTIVRVVKMSI